jgi:hypothetical protein
MGVFHCHAQALMSEGSLQCEYVSSPSHYFRCVGIGYQKYLIKKYMPRRNLFYKYFVRGDYSRPSDCDTSSVVAEEWEEATAFLDRVRSGTFWGEIPLESPFNRKYIAPEQPSTSLPELD